MMDASTHGSYGMGALVVSPKLQASVTGLIFVHSLSGTGTPGCVVCGAHSLDR